MWASPPRTTPICWGVLKQPDKQKAARFSLQLAEQSCHPCGRTAEHFIGRARICLWKHRTCLRHQRSFAEEFRYLLSRQQ